MAGTGAEFIELEEVDAVRMAWNVWPHSRLEAAKCVIPFGVMYTPVKQTTNLQVSPPAAALRLPGGLCCRRRRRRDHTALPHPPGSSHTTNPPTPPFSP